MKNKKVILAAISIIVIALLSTVSFAITSTRTGMTFDEAVQASKDRNNKLKNETSNEVVENEVSNEVVTGNEVNNTESQEPDVEKENPEKNDDLETEKENKIDDEKESNENGKVVEDEDKELEEGDVISFKETMSEDISKVGETVEYKSVYIDGNVHIIAEKVLLEDVKIDGNLFIAGTNVELNNVIIEGTLYIIAENVKVDGQTTSAYIMGNNVVIESYASIIKELRVGASNLEFSGFVGRNLDVYAENIKITDTAEIYGDCIVEASSVDVSEEAKINGEKSIKVIENVNTVMLVTDQAVYSKIITNCVIILIVAIFVLYSSPKFVAVNGGLRLRDFIKSFFTGILELLFVFVLFAVTLYLGYGIGFVFALVILSMLLVYFGKMLFIISAGIRLAGKSENVSRIKSFFVILIVLIIVESSNLLMLVGNNGVLATIIINLVLGIVGFGSLVRVVLTPSRRKKQPKIKSNVNNNIREVRPDDFVMKGAPIETKEVIENKELEAIKVAQEEAQDLKDEKIENKEELIEEVHEIDNEKEENKEDKEENKEEK